jgi:hypothetical protein
MTIYHTILELLQPPTPQYVKAVYVELENRAKVFYPEGYYPSDCLPEIEPNESQQAQLVIAFNDAIVSDGLETTCIEARRALGELLEKIGGQL